MDWAGVARRVWRGRSAAPAALRAALLLPAGVYRAAVMARNAAYDWGVLRSWPLPRPSLGVGNLAVGGAGKTPVAAYLAGELVRRGARPGILLRGYRGGDEAAEHAARNPGAEVVADPDRRRGAGHAVAAGAEVLVLDDCLQRRELKLDVMLGVVAAETAGGRAWPLPAGPWREGRGALRRCDAVVVTFKAAAAGEAERVARALAPLTRRGVGIAMALEIARLVPLEGGAPLPAASLRGRRVVAVSGIGDPELFAAQLVELGAEVRPMPFGDHHVFSASDVAAAVSLAGGAGSGVVVTTAKDAVRLRQRWPASAPTCLVAVLEPRVTYGQEELTRLLDRIGRAAHASPTPMAATEPHDGRTSL
jgi:tetraacyldisaccharide 4'-kinase